MGIKRSGSGLKAGFMADYAGGAIPAGWLVCAGQAVSRATYAALFLAIGTTHGAGDGSTTFNLPDSRGRATFGKDDMNGTPANRITNAVSGINGDTLGAVGGGQSHTLITAEMPTHTHTQNAHSHSYTAGGGVSGTGGIGNAPGPQTTPSVNSATATNQNNGSGGAHRNMPPALIANKLIKY